jgi:hypothetical protein
MAIKLAQGVMPPSNVGRKPKPLDSETVEVLTEALLESVPEEMEDDETGDTKLFPAFVGPDFTEKAHVFTKDHQAQADGRKYAKVVHKRVGKVVRVNVYHNGIVDSSGKPTDATRYTWRLYVPITEYSKEELDELLAEDSPDLDEDLVGMVGGEELEPQEDTDE